MSANNVKAKKDVAAAYQQAITGMQKFLPNKTLVLNGKPVTSKAVVSAFQAVIDAITASAAAHTAWLQAVAKERATTKANGAPLLAILRHFVAAMFGLGSDEYLAFGFQPPKAQVKSPTAKVIAAEKMRETRKARNTLGSKQRLGITGAVPSTITLSVATTPGATPAAAPAQLQPVAAPGATPAQPAGIVTVTTPTSGAATAK